MAKQPAWLLKKLGLEEHIPTLAPHSKGHPGYTTRPTPRIPLTTLQSRVEVATSNFSSIDPRDDAYWARLKEVPSLFLVPGQAKLVTKENSPETLTVSAGVPGSPLSEEPINSPERGDLEENISPSRNVRTSLLPPEKTWKRGFSKGNKEHPH